MLRRRLLERPFDLLIQSLAQEVRLQLSGGLGLCWDAFAVGVGGKPPAFGEEASALAFKTAFAGTGKVGSTATGTA